ncbi:ABC transporter G family member 20-like [Homarus americanus]|uniref:ABC transporter G family member 20-like n=1 Tax=Homarus americanus TaxID=6706 RepID=A0A8J5NDI7_HOMAM|nr:ABC transporter G family member 20-like [Homarus americanus]
MELTSYKFNTSHRATSSKHSVTVGGVTMATEAVESMGMERQEEEAAAPPKFPPYCDVSLTRLDRVTNGFITEGRANPRHRTDGHRISRGSVRGAGKEVGNVVVVQQAYKSYGSGSKKVVVLENLDMRVPQGSIYGLLGPSGCGKTTLLGCLVNRLKLDKGEIFLYGFPPGSAEAAVPGHRVGYMPQELALYQEFTIVETLRYFGRIHLMSGDKISQRTKFLVSFLDLPDPTRLINQLSGGQQRRVSFAAALLHEPDLLILDEPTHNNGFDDVDGSPPHKVTTPTTTTITTSLPTARGVTSNLKKEINSATGQITLRDSDEKAILMKFYSEFDAGLRAVENGDAWGLIFFNETFTKAFLAFYLTDDAHPEDKAQSKINIYMDTTNSEISATLAAELLRTMDRFLVDMIQFSDDLLNITIDTSKLTFPLKFHEPVYGTSGASFTEFMAPGVILTITYFMAVGLTALSFIIERKEGLLDRSWVSGVQSSEVMTAHLATQMLVMLVQIALILVFMFPVFKLPCEGNMLWVVLLSILQGFCGMTFGLMTSAISNDENTAIMMALGIFYPLLLLSGIVWPVQGIPVALRYVSYALPQTYACEAIRAILYKGWDITYPTVYMGYLITLGWLLLHLVLALIAMRIRK